MLHLPQLIFLPSPYNTGDMPFNDIFKGKLEIPVLIYSPADDSADESSDSNDESNKAPKLPPYLLVAEPPQILQPYHYITKQPGPTRECFGFRICGDNIDKKVRTRYMQSDMKNSSLHYFHSYAVLNRIDSSSLSDEIPDNMPT